MLTEIRLESDRPSPCCSQSSSWLQRSDKLPVAAGGLAAQGCWMESPMGAARPDP
jgi:hypothetical protein